MMRSYLLMHDGAVIAANDVSHPSFLPDAPAGDEWVEVPFPAAGQTAETDGEGGYIVSPRVPTMDEARVNLKAQVKALRDAAETGGCTVDGIGRFDTDADSQRKLNGAVVLAMLGGEAFEIEWRLTDNSVVTLSAPQMIAVGGAIGAHVAACQYRKNELDAALDVATDYAALMAIDIESGWPS